MFQQSCTLNELDMEILVIHSYWVGNEDPPKWVTDHHLWPPRKATVKMVRDIPVYIADDQPLMRRYHKIIDRMSIQLGQRRK